MNATEPKIELSLNVKRVGDGKFLVQGRSLVCARCGHCADAQKQAVGELCPKCGVDGGVLKRAEHLVDPLDYNGVGSCTCGQWTFTIQKALNRMSPTERREARGRDDLLCDHIRAAIKFMADWKQRGAEPDGSGVAEPIPPRNEAACSRCGARFTPPTPEIPAGTPPALAAALARLFMARPVCAACIEAARSAARESRPMPTGKLVKKHVPQPAPQARLPYPD